VAEGSLGVAEVRAWFGEYLRVYAAFCRGDCDDTRQLLQYFGVPLLLTTDATAVALTNEDEVVGAVGQQIDDCEVPATPAPKRSIPRPRCSTRAPRSTRPTSRGCGPTTARSREWDWRT
jgi:hypothetical protein